MLAPPGASISRPSRVPARCGGVLARWAVAVAVAAGVPARLEARH